MRTDYNSLIWLMRFKNNEGQLARWIEELQNYDMELLYRAGRDHGNADGMSHLPDMVELCKGEQQLFHAGYALERVHIDIMGPLVETQKGNKYILVIVDQFTMWVEAFPIKNQLAETVAGVVVREFVARFGCPLEMHTDLRPALHLP